MNGAEDAFNDLYQANAKSILGYLLRRGATPEDAADITADVFAATWAQREKLPPEEERRPWLFGIARNRLRRHRKTAHRQREGVQLLATAVQTQVDDSEPSPSWVDLTRAFRKLRAGDVEIVTLAGWEGFTSREIAQILSIPDSTVRVRLKRARARLRTALALDDAHPQRPDPAPAEGPRHRSTADSTNWSTV